MYHGDLGTGLTRRGLLCTGGAVLAAASLAGCDRLTAGPAKEAQEGDRGIGGQPALEDEVVVVAAGDIAAPPDIPPHRTRARQADTADLVESLQPHAVLALGDLQYESGTLANYLASYDRSWGRFKDITHPVIGNHEFSPDGKTGYFDYFGDAAGDPDKGYYSFDLGVWHLIALDSQCREVNGGCDPGSPQDRWLRADLAAHRDRPTLAFFHDPRFTSGPKRPSREMRTFWHRLYDAGVDVILNGNEHNYERFAPQDPHGNHDPKRGIPQFIVGTGGINLLPALGKGEPNSLVRHGESFGVLKLVLRPTEFSWSFHSVDGGPPIDSGSRPCH